MSLGTIKKLVLVPSTEGVLGDPDYRREGYGILQAADGREVFFLHTAVLQSQFAQLQSGQEVRFEVEDGPLGRASLVVPLERHCPQEAQSDHQARGP